MDLRLHGAATRITLRTGSLRQGAGCNPEVRELYGAPKAEGRFRQSYIPSGTLTVMFGPV